MLNARRRSIAVTPNNNASKSPTPKTPFTKLSSLPVKSVQLHKWWLVSADGKGLAVAGFASRESIGVRTFSSAAIVMRHDNTTLGTADGITVTITSSISRSRTHLNGFPLEVCNHFECGFPSYWEEYANQCYGQTGVAKVVPTRSSCFVNDDISSGSPASTSQPFSLYETPLTEKRDFSISSAQVLLDEALQKCGNTSVQVESARKREKNVKVHTPSRSIVTRSMSRMKNIVIEKEGSLASKSFVGDKESVTSKAAGKRSLEVGSESDSEECQETTFPQEAKKKLVGNPDISVFRRSSRLMNLKKPISVAQPHL